MKPTLLPTFFLLFGALVNAQQATSELPVTPGKAEVVNIYHAGLIPSRVHSALQLLQHSSGLFVAGRLALEPSA